MIDMEIALGLENAKLRTQLAKARDALEPCMQYMAGVVESGYDEDGLNELVQRAHAALSSEAPDEETNR